MQQLPTFNFGLTKKFFFNYCTLSMRQKTKNYQIKGPNAKKMFKFFLFSKSHTQMGLVYAKNASKKFSRLGTFKMGIMYSKLQHRVFFFSVSNASFLYYHSLIYILGLSSDMFVFYESFRSNPKFLFFTFVGVLRNIKSLSLTLSV
jgi:hypothetical protein